MNVLALDPGRISGLDALHKGFGTAFGETRFEVLPVRNELGESQFFKTGGIMTEKIETFRYQYVFSPKIGFPVFASVVWILQLTPSPTLLEIDVVYSACKLGPAPVTLEIQRIPCHMHKIDQPPWLKRFHRLSADSHYPITSLSSLSDVRLAGCQCQVFCVIIDMRCEICV
jgi:hypothetical protein